jgi:hypothetical protein
MSGYRVENSTDLPYGETLLMRTLPLVTNPLRKPLYGGSINFKHINNPIIDALIVSAADGSADSVYRKVPPHRSRMCLILVRQNSSLLVRTGRL